MSLFPKIQYDRYKNLATQGRQLHLIYLSICSFQVVASLSLTDIDVFLEKSIELPIFNIPVPLTTFFVVVPIILFPISLYFFIHLDSLKRAHSRYNQEDHLHIYPWEMIDRMATNERVPSGGSFFNRLFKKASRKVRIFTGEMFLWNYLPLTLLLTAFLMMRIHHRALNIYFVVSIVGSLATAAFFKWKYYGCSDFGTLPVWLRRKVPTFFSGPRFAWAYHIFFRNLFLIALLIVNLAFLLKVFDRGPQVYLHHSFLNLNLQNENLFKESDNHRSGILTNRDFRHGEFAHTVFDSLILNGTDFSGSNLINASFKGASLVNCKFEGTEMLNADFSNANLTGSSFKNAHLQESKFDNTELGSVYFKNARLEYAKLEFAKGLTDLKITEAGLLTGATLPQHLSGIRDIAIFWHLFRTPPWTPEE